MKKRINNNIIRLVYEGIDQASLNNAFDIINSKRHHYGKGYASSGINSVDSTPEEYNACQRGIVELEVLKTNMAEACILSPIIEMAVDLAKFERQEDKELFTGVAGRYEEALRVDAFKSLEPLCEKLQSLEHFKLLLSDLDSTFTVNICGIDDNTSPYIRRAIECLRDNSIGKVNVQVNGVPYDISGPNANLGREKKRVGE